MKVELITPPPPPDVRIELSREEAFALQELTGWHVTVPNALRAAKAGVNYDAIAKVMIELNLALYKVVGE